MMSLSPRTVSFSAGERNVFLHILTGCNLSCSHCYINPAQHGNTMLSRDKIDAWLRLFADRNRQANVIFLGGEPTMHPDLVDAVDAAHGYGYTTTVDTNGYLFHDFLDRINISHLDYLSFSLDGPDEHVNDPIRGKGVFDVCTANLRRAVEKGVTTSLIYTVSSRNIEHLHRMVPLVRQLGISRFFIQVIGLRGKSAGTSAGVDREPLQIAPERWLEVVPEVARQVAEIGIDVIYPKVYLEDGEQFHCAGQVAENFFVFPNGRVYQCPLCEDYPLHSFEIDNDRLVPTSGLSERQLFTLNIAEGCVMNKLLQPDTIVYDATGRPLHRISCCLLKQRMDGVTRVPGA